MQRRFGHVIGLVRELTRGTFVRSMGAIFRTNIILQILTFASLPVLTRIYSPTEYGAFALTITVSGYLTLITTVRYDMAIDVPLQDELARALLQFCLLNTIVVCSGTAIATLFFSTEISKMLRNDAIGALLRFLPIIIACSSYQTLVAAWSARQRNFSSPSNIRLAGALADVSTKLGLGAAGFLHVGQIVGTTAGAIVLASLSAMSAYRNGFELLSGFSVRSAWRAAVEYRRFPLLAFPASLLEMTAFALPPILIAAYFGPTAVGLFYVADRLTQVPSVAVSSAVRPVFKRHAAIVASEGGSIRPLLLRTMTATGLLGLLSLLGFVFVVPSAFEWLLDSRWQSAMGIVQLLAVGRAMEIFVNPVSPILLVRQKHISSLTLQAFLVLGTGGAFLVGGLNRNIYLAVALYCGVLVAKYAAELFVCYRNSANFGTSLSGE